MKTLILCSSILFLSYFNIYPQLDLLERPRNEERAINDFSKPALSDSTQLDSLIINAMNNYHIPGVAALINTKDEGIIWKQNYGYADIALNKPVEDSTLFLMGSISKTIVATAIMQFWEADSFDLDDNINNYLDNFQIINPYYPNDTITIRMLMTHTSSLRDWGNWNFLYTLTSCGDSPIALDSFLINYLTPGGIYYSALSYYNFAPGSAWEYANVDVCVLALLVEKFSGMSFNQYCRENIFDPLEMDKTSWFLEGMDTMAIATPYLWQGGNQYTPYCHQGHPIYPAGFLRTNKMELEHLLSAYMNWGKYNGTTILDSLTVDLILTDQLGYPVPGYGDHQGLIWYQSGELNGRFPWGHGGSWWGCRTGMFFKQEEDWGIICFINSTPNYEAILYLLNILCDYAQDITEVKEKSVLISDFYLEQNYPNPFNPSTTIKYQIPASLNPSKGGTLVTLKVFDVLGNEIETLVKEEKPAGIYELIWNAANLPSGVYFYQLSAGSFIETKKMVLLK
jgi:CubicO group peptidase (beta-lactamase class C family)